MIDKLQDQIFKYKRDLIVAQVNKDQLEVERLKLCIKRRIVKMYEYNLQQLKKK